MWAASPAGGTCEYCKQFASGEHGATSPAGDVCEYCKYCAFVANTGQHHQLVVVSIANIVHGGEYGAILPAGIVCEQPKFCASGEYAGPVRQYAPATWSPHAANKFEGCLAEGGRGSFQGCGADGDGTGYFSRHASALPRNSS